MSEEKKKEVIFVSDSESEELSDDALEMVSGGAGMRRTKKEQTTDISFDTRSKI